MLALVAVALSSCLVQGRQSNGVPTVQGAGSVAPDLDRLTLSNASAISDARVTDVTDQGFVVSWVSAGPETATVRYAPAVNGICTSAVPARTVNDVRGASTSSASHYVQVAGLTPNSTYCFDIVSGSTTESNGGRHFEVTTGPTLEATAPENVLGHVSTSAGADAPEAVVYLTIGNGRGTSATVSGLVDRAASGDFFVDVSTIRTSNNQSLFAHSGTDTLTISAQAGPLGSATITTTVATGTSSAGAPSIRLAGGAAGASSGAASAGAPTAPSGGPAGVASSAGGSTSGTGTGGAATMPPVRTDPGSSGAGGAAGTAPATGDMRAVAASEQILLTASPNLLAALPAGRLLNIVLDVAPTGLNEVQRGSLGGGVVVPIGQPLDIQAQVTDRTSGVAAPLPEGSRDQLVKLELPIPPLAAAQIAQDPSTQFAWLHEFRVNGQFLGYLRLDTRFNPATGLLEANMPVGELNGTLFLPAFIVPAYVQIFDPDLTHIYSGPTTDAADFGVAAPQFTTFVVVAPQIATRLYVFNPATGNYGWIDVMGIGPVPGPA